MAPTAAPLSIYQAATLGRTLYESLLELVTEQKIRPELAERVMQQYDQAVADVFDEKNGGGATITGKLHVYRGCNSVWTFFVKNALIKESGSVQELGREPREMVAELLKVVLVDGTGRLPPARRG